jgi:mRNA-binding protein PUF3
MSSATSNRPSAAMTSAVRSSQFPQFGAAPGRHNSDSSQSSTLGQTFGNGGSWQASSGIWGSGAIGSAFSDQRRDASRSRAPASNDLTDGPSGSGALAASSQADPWGTRATGPWNPPDTTSPTLKSHSGSASPSHARNSIPNIAQPTLLEIQNSYQQTRPAIGQVKSFGRPQPKSSLDPSSGTFSFGRKPSFVYDDKENSAIFSSPEYDNDASYLPVRNIPSRDASMPPSRSESGPHVNGLSFGSANGPFNTFGHTPQASIHSQRPSLSNASLQFPATNGSRYDLVHAEAELSDKLGGFSFNREVEQPNGLVNNNGSSYSPSNQNFPQQGYPFGASSGAWNEAPKAFSYDTHPSQPFADQAYLTKAPRFNERGSISPAGSDYRRGLNSPKYFSTNGTPSSEQVYRPNSRGPRLQHGPTELDRRLQTLQQAQAAQAYLFANGHFQGQYPPQPYEYAPAAFRPTNVPYGYPMPIPTYPAAQPIPTHPAKDQDVGLGVRSVLLEEFRSNSKSSKKYELKDIYHHVVEFSGDQHGSRFIQQKLETANSDEKEQLFREIQPNALQLMTDVFGNYVIQKLFEHGNQVQKRVLAEQMKNHVMELSTQMYGCRVVQKALEHVLANQQAELVEELKADVLKCVKDQNGNHVVQKAIERVPSDHIQFIIEAFRGQVHVLAAHPYGCRVIQRILEYCKPHDQAGILEELHQCFPMLITDQYGNYVTQHVIQHGKPEDRAKVIKIVTSQLLVLSKHKFASNVVEKSIQFGTDEQRKAIVAQLTTLHSDGTSPMQLMMKDQYGNYVIQKLLGQLKGAEREAFVESLKPHLLQLKKYNYGKQIMAIEKLIFTGPPTYITPASVTPATQAFPIEIASNAPTPTLTNGQNSPQSSSLPSTNVSTIEEPSDSTCKPIEISGKTCPEVVINGL